MQSPDNSSQVLAQPPVLYLGWLEGVNAEGTMEQMMGWAQRILEDPVPDLSKYCPGS